MPIHKYTVSTSAIKSNEMRKYSSAMNNMRIYHSHLSARTHTHVHEGMICTHMKKKKKKNANERDRKYRMKKRTAIINDFMGKKRSM